MVIVNETYEINGAFSFNINIDRSKKPAIVSIEGALETDVYIKDLKSLRNERYALTNIEVYSESYGSDDNNIIYHFSAGSSQRYPIEGRDEI